jgi:hypothetical protein
MSNIQLGSKVKFITELEPGENNNDMTVIELNGDRCIIRTDLGWDNLNPTNVVMVNELKLA